MINAEKNTTLIEQYYIKLRRYTAGIEMVPESLLPR